MKIDSLYMILLLMVIGESACAQQNKIPVVLMGDSITQGWPVADAEFFEGKNYTNKGIGGQTTPQMLERFTRDVIDVKPKIVVILAGTNDIAGNTGTILLETTMNNIVTMAVMAKANNIKVVLCSVLPAIDFPWKPGMQPSEKIIALNHMIQSYAEKNQMAYADYYSVMVDEGGGLNKAFSGDGVHPNKKGYQAMAPILEKAINDSH